MKKQTTAERRKALIDRATTVAINIAHRLRHHKPWYDTYRGHDWKTFDYKKGFWKTTVFSEQHIEFRHNDSAIITFTNIRPKGDFKTIVHPATLLDQKVTDVRTTEVRNNASFPVERNYAFTETRERTTTEDVGVSFALEIRQLFSYGGDIWGGKGETEITANISTSYNKQTGIGHTVERETETNLTIPPKTLATVTNRIETAKFRQDVEVVGDLDYSFEVYSHRDYKIKFESVDDWVTLLLGYSLHNDALRAVNDKYRALPAVEDNERLYGMNLSVVREIKFDDAKSGNLDVTSKDL